MGTCPDCGMETVPAPDGAEAHCGRRISWSSIADASEHDWRRRVSTAEICKRVGRERRRKKDQGTET